MYDQVLSSDQLFFVQESMKGGGWCDGHGMIIFVVWWVAFECLCHRRCRSQGWRWTGGDRTFRHHDWRNHQHVGRQEAAPRSHPKPWHMRRNTLFCNASSLLEYGPTSPPEETVSCFEIILVSCKRDLQPEHSQHAQGMTGECVQYFFHL